MQYTLSQILEIYTRGCNELFGEFDFWCVAEVAKYTQRGKFSYLELVEYATEGTAASGTVLAKTHANIWDSSVVSGFLHETKLQIEELAKQQILFHGKYAYHPVYGFSISIDAISPTYTMGKMQQAKHAILDILVAEGIAEHNVRLPAPSIPMRLAVISGAHAAGYEDFIAILDDTGIAYEVTLFTATVHGNAAKQEVYNALQEIYRRVTVRTDEGATRDDRSFDLVCIVRGGGDTTGISRQNDLDIARGICHMPIPVMVAVGHTQDTSVLQQVSWWFAKTPSDAAHEIVGMYEDMSAEILALWEGIAHACEAAVAERRVMISRRYEGVSRGLMTLLDRRIERAEELYRSITAYHPEHLLARGYAMVRAEELTVGQDIVIDTLQNTIVATVKSVAKRVVDR